MKKLLVGVVMVVLAGCGDNTPAMDMTPAPRDMSMVAATDGAGTKMFGDQCFTPGSPGDCAAGLICDMFVMNTINRCTRLCDAAQAMNGCPAPSNGTCNGKNECKFLQ
jgi:hypothetical protein